MATRTVKSRITGRVQGVGFRAWVLREARKRHLNGWVRNRNDGSVEAVFSGDFEDVTDMMLNCYIGPVGSRVTEMVTDPYAGEVGVGFEVR
ncbi:MAG: acylphosphatase [Proteobacteria bacterium]|nr:acylphosphatase [Pseudomonadota bacterium]